MTAQTVPGVAEVRMQYVSDSQSCENVYHVEHGLTGWSLTDLETLAGLFETWEDTVAKTHRTNGTSLINIITTDLTSLAGFRIVTPPVAPIVGTGGTHPQPNNVTLAVHADIGTRGRGKSGRVFFIGLDETFITGDTVSNAEGDAIVNDLDALLANIVGHDPTWHMCVPHRVVAGVKPPVVGYTDVRDWGLSDFTVDSQKLRLPNHKKHKKPSTRV